MSYLLLAAGSQEYDISISDSVSVSETLVVTKPQDINLSENITVSDAEVFQTQYVRSGTETTSVTDTLSKTSEEAFVDTLSTSDNGDRAVSYVRSRADTSSVSDQTAVTEDKVQIVVDTCSVSDVTTRETDYLFIDTITVTDTTATSLEYLRTTGTDTVVITETNTTESKFIGISENIDVTDTTIKEAYFNKPVIETVSLVEALIKNAAFNRKFSEFDYAVTDSVTTKLRPISVKIHESVVVHDFVFPPTKVVVINDTIIGDPLFLVDTVIIQTLVPHIADTIRVDTPFVGPNDRVVVELFTPNITLHDFLEVHDSLHIKPLPIQINEVLTLFETRFIERIPLTGIAHDIVSIFDVVTPKIIHTTPPLPPSIFSAKSRLDYRRLQHSLFRLMDPPSSPEEFARDFSASYENFAKSASPTPIVTGRRGVMEKILLGGFRSPAINPTHAANTIINAITSFWIGVAVPGGVVTAFLGQQIIAAEFLSNSLSTSDPIEGSKRLARCLLDSTKLVQYVIPPNAPQFLV